MNKSLLGSTFDLADIFDWCKKIGVELPSPGAGPVMPENSLGLRMASSGPALCLDALQESVSELYDGTLVMPFGPAQVIKNQYKQWLVWRKDMRLSPNQEKFVRWITDYAAKDRQLINRFLSA